jgi:hypothetical protein
MAAQPIRILRLLANGVAIALSPHICREMARTAVQSYLQRLARPEADALGAKLQRARRVGHILVIVVSVDDLAIFKTSSAHGAEELYI